MRFGLFVKKLVAGFAVVAALGGAVLSEGAMPPSAVDSVNEMVAPLQMRIPSAQNFGTFRTVFMNFAKVVAATEKESHRADKSVKYERMASSGSAKKPVV